MIIELIDNDKWAAEIWLELQQWLKNIVYLGHYLFFLPDNMGCVWKIFINSLCIKN